MAVAASALIAVPIGLIIGHTGRGTLLVVGAVNGLRALPTLGVLLLGVLLFGLGLGPPMVALMLLGVPSLLAGTYAGIANVDPTVVDAARAMGMTETQVLLRVEVPNALPLILGGLRSATLQVVATATVAAYASLGGLGRLPDRRDQGAPISPRPGRCADGGGVGADPRRPAGAGGVGVGARHRAAAQARRRVGDPCRRAQFRQSLPRSADTLYGRRVNAAPSDPTPRVWPAMLTWRAQDVSRMESVRVQLSGKRIRANGRIVAAATATNPAFGAFYELQTDEKRCHQAVRAYRHAGRAGTPAGHCPRRGEHVVGHRPPGRAARGIQRRSRRRRGVQPVLQRAADPPPRAYTNARTRSSCRWST